MWIENLKVKKWSIVQHWYFLNIVVWSSATNLGSFGANFNLFLILYIFLFCKYLFVQQNLSILKAHWQFFRIKLTCLSKICSTNTSPSPLTSHVSYFPEGKLAAIKAFGSILSTHNAGGNNPRLNFMARVTNKFSLASITFHQSAVASTSKHPPENWLRSEMAYSRRKWVVISFRPPTTASRGTEFYFHNAIASAEIERHSLAPRPSLHPFWRKFGNHVTRT